jgi:acylglycerol lipase
MTVPLLVMQGAMDCVVDPLSSERWAESSGSTDKTFELFPDHMHELLNEPDRDETIDSLLEWLDARVA